MFAAGFAVTAGRARDGIAAPPLATTAAAVTPFLVMDGDEVIALGTALAEATEEGGSIDVVEEAVTFPAPLEEMEEGNSEARGAGNCIVLRRSTRHLTEDEELIEGLVHRSVRIFILKGLLHGFLELFRQQVRLDVYYMTWRIEQLRVVECQTHILRER